MDFIDCSFKGWVYELCFDACCFITARCLHFIMMPISLFDRNYWTTFVVNLLQPFESDPYTCALCTSLVGNLLVLLFKLAPVDSVWGFTWLFCSSSTEYGSTVKMLHLGLTWIMVVQLPQPAILYFSLWSNFSYFCSASHESNYILIGSSILIWFFSNVNIIIWNIALLNIRVGLGPC
jgi:hypothetical protein